MTYARVVMNRYQREIANLHLVPPTNGTVREFWVRSPNWTWQFFLVRNDSVLEIRADGVDIPPESLPVVSVDQSGTPAEGIDNPLSPSEDGD